MKITIQPKESLIYSHSWSYVPTTSSLFIVNIPIPTPHFYPWFFMIFGLYIVFFYS